MKVLVDLSGRITNSSITVYAKRLLTGWIKNHHTDIVILCSPQIYHDIKSSFPTYSCIKFEKQDTYIKNCMQWRKQTKGIDYDVVLVPHAEPFYALLGRKKIVLVFHDLQGLRVRKGLYLWKTWLKYPISLIKSYKIITISHFVEKDILKTYPFISANKLKTIYNGIRVEKGMVDVSPIAQNYLLYVSVLQEYKNVITLIRAFNLLKKDIAQNLVIIGIPTPYWNETIVPFIMKMNLQDRIIHVSHRVDDKTLSQYYQHASLFVHPSLHEGFGYTPIEAAIHEIPVLSSKTTALYETTMGLLNYYEPATDEKAMAEKIKFLLQNPPSAKQLKEISLTLQKQYDNEQQAEKIYNYLKDVYQQSL